jgi:signal transduction histidine kinase
LQRIVSKLVAPIAMVGFLLIVTAAVSAWYVRDIQRRLSLSLTENVASVVAAQELVTSIREVDARLDQFLITEDRSHLEAIPRLRVQSEKALLEAEQWALTSEEKALMAHVRKGYDHLFADYDRAMTVSDKPELRKQIAVAATRPETEILEPARAYRKLNEESLARTSQATAELSDRLTIALLALGLCGAIGGLLGGWAIATRIWRSMQRTELRLLATAARLGHVARQDSRDPAELVDESVSVMLDRLRQSERDALRAEQLAQVGQMAAGVAHEVRNPLASIKLLVQAAASPSRETPFRAKDLEVMEREIGRLEQIVSGFLDFARPPRPQKSSFHLKPFLCRIVDAWRTRVERQHVTISVTAPDSLTIVADEGQLRQVIDNLINNALEAQPAGGRVEITAIAPEGRRSGVVIRVGDQGPGMQRDLMEKAFEPFVSTKETGLGLGLSICRRIVELHGGTITNSPRPGGGTTFDVELPSE